MESNPQHYPIPSLLRGLLKGELQRPTINKMKDSDIDDCEWFDCWCDRHFHLMEKKDYAALVLCCQERLDRDHDDLHAVEALAEAYGLNNQHQAAIDMLTPYYKQDPDHPLFAHAILKALIATGRTIKDFPWVTIPEVRVLGADILEACYEHLKVKRKPRTTFDLYYMLTGDAFLLFSEEELLQAILSDRRFIVSDPEGMAEISVVRNK